MASCGNNAKNEQSDNSDSNATANSVNNSVDSLNNPIHDVFHAHYSSATGAYATIEIDKSYDLKNDAWIGLCPTGKTYYDEREADDLDVIFFYMEEYVEGEDYVYVCDFESVENGTYVLVVATSDDEEVGHIAIQLEMTKTDDSISFNYDSAVINEK